MEEGKVDLAREALQSASRLDPDLSEPRWARLALAIRTRQFRTVVAEFLGAIRATLADGESRRVLMARGVLVLAYAGLVMSVAILVILYVRHGRRLVHDVAETTGRLVPAGYGTDILVFALLLAPLLLSFDVLWFLLYLFVLVFGYATWPQRVGAIATLALTVPILPLVDRTSYELAVASSPVVRSAEALGEARYDQRVVDGLEQARSLLPEDADLRFLLGRVYQALGQNERAVVEYSSAAQLSTRESRALVNRGNIRFVDGDLRSAQEDYLEALRRDPQSVQARYNLALVYAETFRTVEAVKILNEARELDAAMIQSFQEAPTLVRVVSLGYSAEEARRKSAALQKDERGRHLLGLFRSYRPAAGWSVPILAGIPLAVVVAVLLDRRRQKGRGYASECQKCGRTFCRLCKPSGESSLLCSQCVHVYLKKDGVAIETKLQKLEDVRRRKAVDERLLSGLNLFLPGTFAFLESRVFVALLALLLFSMGLVGIVLRQHFAVVPRPGPSTSLPGLVFWGAVAASGWTLGQATARSD
jgi:tetratricopeptide (TPR) repeat protein